MITAKRIYYSAALVVAGLILAASAAYLLVGDETLLAWGTQRAESAAGVKISYRQPAKLSRTLWPTLTVSDLSVSDPETGYGVQTSSLELQISLPRLILGQLDIPRLWLGDTRVDLGDAATSGKQATGPSAGGLGALPPMPALHDVQIAGLRVISADKELRLPTLEIDELALDFETETDTLALTAQIELAGRSVAIEASVPRFHSGVNARKLDFSASASGAAATLLANGYVDFDRPELIVDGELSAQASDLSQLPTGIQGLMAPGTLEAQAQLAGTMDRLGVRDILLQWRGPQQSSLGIKGSIDDLDDFSGVALDVSGQLGAAPWLTAVLPDSVGELQHAQLSGQVSGGATQLAIRDFSLTARDANDLDVSLRGQLDLAVAEGHAAAENIDVDLEFSAPTTRAARALLFEDIPEFGAVKGSAAIHSETGPPAFENIVVSVRDPAGIEVDLKGRIAQFPLSATEPNRGYDLDVSMKATRLVTLGERLNLSLPLDGPADASYRIEGDTQALRLEGIKAAAGEKKALSLAVDGQVHFGHWDQPDPLKMINLGLRAHSRDTGVLAKQLDTEFPELGALRASARLQTLSNRHQIVDFELRNAKGAPVSVALRGKADRVLLSPQPAVEGIALKASASTADVSRLNTLFGWQDAVPAIGPAKAGARLSGSDQNLAVSGVSITAGKPDTLLLEASGGLGTVSAASDWQPQNAELNLRASATGSKALTELLGYPVPELGPLAASAKLRDKKNRFGLQSGRLVIGDATRPAIQAEGFVDDLFGAGKTRWDVELDLDGNQFAAFANEEKLPDLGALRGKLQVSNSDGSLGVDTLSLKSTGSDLLTLDVSGQYADFSKPESLSLTGQLKARDMQVVGALLERDWPQVGPVSIDTRISKSDKHTAFDTKMTADRFELDADLVADFDADPPRLSGNIKARNAFIPQMAVQTAEGVKKKQEAKSDFFSREPMAFDWLNKLDVDVSVDIESFDAELARGESGQARIKLESGRLSVSPVTIKYPKGQLEVDIQVEAQQRPSIKFKAFGANLDPWRSLYIENQKKEVDADLDIDIELELSGASAHELAASANGSVFFELKNGLLSRSLVDLVFVDIIGWAWGKTSHKKYYEFSCGVADYSIDQGVITTRAFLLDASEIAISGEGSIDLGKEEVDYVFLPKKKSRLINRADPVKVTGALNDPKVKVIPWKAATSTYGTLLFAPYIFVGATAVDMIGGVFKKNAIKESPCLAYEKKRAEGVPWKLED